MKKKDKQIPDARKGAGALVFLWAVIGMIIVVSAALIALFDVRSTTAGGPELPEDIHADRLETAPQRDLARYLSEKDALLSRYEWVDRKNGIAAIPIEMAMDSLSKGDDQDKESEAGSQAGDAAVTRTRDVAPDMPESPVEFKQNLGVQLPPQLKFADQDGKQRRLGDLFGADPIVLILGYYQCPALCSTVMTSLLQAIHGIDLPYRIVAVSIDPRETPEIAARQFAVYAEDNADAATPTAQHSFFFLTGKNESIASLARYAGFGWEYDEGSDQFSHPAGFMVLTPEGKVSRYFPGASFRQRDLRLALIDAAESRTGSLAERIVLMCSHYDPVKGRYTLAVMSLVRIFGIVLILVLGIVFWRLQRGRRS